MYWAQYPYLLDCISLFDTYRDNNFISIKVKSLPGILEGFFYKQVVRATLLRLPKE